MTEREKKLKDIMRHPRKHRHTEKELIACSTIDGAFDQRIAEAHRRYVFIGENGGIRCDVTEGACACGAWH